MSESELIALTGATGFVGGKMVDFLLERGHRLRVLVRDPQRAGHLRRDGVEIVIGDIRDAASLRGFAEGASKFFHIASLFRQARYTDDVYWQINRDGVTNCLEEARRAGVKRFVHCSTVGVLSNIDNPPADEMRPYNPGDIYQVTKAEGEKIALEWFREGRIPGVVIRPAMIYGDGDLRMLKLFKGVARKRFVMVGSGETLAHYVYIDDLLEAFWIASQAEGVNGEVFIIAGPDHIKLNDLVRIIAEEAGVPPPRLKIPAWPVQWAGSLCEAVMIPLGLEPPLYRRRVDFFVKNRSFNTDKARRMLGFTPKIDMREGVRRTLRWYLDQKLI